MNQDKLEKHGYEDNVATQKDLKILGLEIEGKILNVKIELDNKISSITLKLGSLMIACSSILFGLLSYFHR